MIFADIVAALAKETGLEIETEGERARREICPSRKIDQRRMIDFNYWSPPSAIFASDPNANG